MAQFNITFNQEEILQVLADNSGNAFKKLLRESLNAVMIAESDEQIHAERYERSDERTDSRNGFRDRDLNTRIGTITLHVPRHRNQPFKTLVFENYSRSEAALISCMAEMVVNGVSTRKVSTVMETLCGTSFSKSEVSETCKSLDTSVKAFKERMLTGKYPFLTVDATYFKVRENHRVISKAFMVALATDEHGHREVVGFNVYDNESIQTWTDFLQSLKKRGLTEVMMITSDAHEGIKHAISQVYPMVPWQRCQFHFSKNIADKVPKKYQAGIRSELQEMFNCDTLEAARKKCKEILEQYMEVAEDAMKCLEEGFESAFTVLLLPKGFQRYYRTSNHIERLNKELKRRSKVIGIFPNQESLLRLMGTVLQEKSDAMQNTKAVFSNDSLKKLFDTDVKKKLEKVAEEQRALLAA